MGRKFIPARVPSGEAPQVTSYPYVSGQTFKLGAVLYLDPANAGQVKELSMSVPKRIIGVAMEDAGSRPGFQLGFGVTQVTGRKSENTVAIADAVTVWSGRGTADPAATDIGKKYGVTKVGDDWIVAKDKTQVADQVLEVTDVDLDRDIYFFKWLAAKLAIS